MGAPLYCGQGGALWCVSSAGGRQQSTLTLLALLFTQVLVWQSWRCGHMWSGDTCGAQPKPSRGALLPPPSCCHSQYPALEHCPQQAMILQSSYCRVAVFWKTTNCFQQTSFPLCMMLEIQADIRLQVS